MSPLIQAAVSAPKTIAHGGTGDFGQIVGLIALPIVIFGIVVFFRWFGDDK